MESLFLPVQKQIATRLQDQDRRIASLEVELLAEQEKNRKLEEERVVDAQKAKDYAQKTKAAELEAADWKSKFLKLKAKRDEARAKHNSYIAEDPDLD